MKYYEFAQQIYSEFQDFTFEGFCNYASKAGFGEDTAALNDYSVKKIIRVLEYIVEHYCHPDNGLEKHCTEKELKDPRSNHFEGKAFESVGFVYGNGRNDNETIDIELLLKTSINADKYFSLLIVFSAPDSDKKLAVDFEQRNRANVVWSHHRKDNMDIYEKRADEKLSGDCLLSFQAECFHSTPPERSGCENDEMIIKKPVLIANNLDCEAWFRDNWVGYVRLDIVDMLKENEEDIQHKIDEQLSDLLSSDQSEEHSLFSRSIADLPFWHQPRNQG